MRLLVDVLGDQVAILRETNLSVYHNSDLSIPIWAIDIPNELYPQKICWLSDAESLLAVFSSSHAAYIITRLGLRCVHALPCIKEPPVELSSLHALTLLHRARNVDIISIYNCEHQLVNFPLKTTWARLLRPHPCKSLFLYSDLIDNTLFLVAANGSVLRHEIFDHILDILWADNGRGIIVVNPLSVSLFDLQLHFVKKICSLTPHKLRSIVTSLNGSFVAIATDNTISVWDLKELVEIYTIQLDKSLRVKSLNWDHYHLIALTVDGKGWRLWPGEHIFYELGFRARAISLLPDGMLAWSSDRCVLIVDKHS